MTTDPVGLPGSAAVRRYPARPIVGVGAVIVLADMSIVLVRRAREPLAGRWSLPGGALELGETLRAAVAREVREETGLVVEVGPILDAVDHIDLDATGRVVYQFVVVDFLCWPAEGVLTAGGDVDAVAAVTEEGLASYALTVPARAVIRRARELYAAGGRRS